MSFRDSNSDLRTIRSVRSVMSYMEMPSSRSRNKVTFKPQSPDRQKLLLSPPVRRGAKRVSTQQSNELEKPKFEISNVVERLEALSMEFSKKLSELSEYEILDTSTSRIMTFSNRLTSMDDMVSHINFTIIEEPVHHFQAPDNQVVYFADEDKPQKMSPFIKVILRETDDIVLFEKSSVTVLKGTDEAKLVENDNRQYEHLTSGKGQNRRKRESETQTTKVLCKSKSINTDIIQEVNTGAYVSNYDMYDTYENTERYTKSIELSGDEKLDITTYKIEDLNSFEEFSKTHRFNLAVMLTQRQLASNVFREKQKRFRNMIARPDRLALNVKYLYRLEVLWTYSSTVINNSVSCMCWCPNNGDILAVAYGIFHIDSQQDRHTGYVAIWNIKNPINPEKKIKYNVPVVSVEFSQFTPQIIAIGLYDGTVEIRDITDEHNSLVGTNHGCKVAGSEPIVAMKWMSDTNQNVGDKKQSLLAASTDGSIIRYQLGSGFYLIGYLHIKLDRVELDVEGLLVDRTNKFIEANRHPQITDLVKNSIWNDEFYVLTDEGCYYKCSMNFPHQHLDVFQLHQGTVFGMDWSPFSPKVFLTCGNDWYIRIWIVGIHEPIISLSSGVGPVNCAYWSSTHSFIIVAVTSNAVEIWDIRRNLLKPVSTHDFDKKIMNSFTVVRFSKCGRSIAIGDIDGNVILASFEDMPFQPCYQYNELEKALYKATMAYPDLTLQIQNLGYFGHEDDKILNK